MSNIELFKFFNHRIKIENIDKAIKKLINKNLFIGVIVFIIKKWNYAE